MLLNCFPKIVAYYFNDALMNSEAHESDLKQQQIEEKEEEKLEYSMVLVYSLSLSLEHTHTKVVN